MLHVAWSLLVVCRLQRLTWQRTPSRARQPTSSLPCSFIQAPYAALGLSCSRTCRDAAVRRRANAFFNSSNSRCNQANGLTQAARAPWPAAAGLFQHDSYQPGSIPTARQQQKRRTWRMPSGKDGTKSRSRSIPRASVHCKQPSMSRNAIPVAALGAPCKTRQVPGVQFVCQVWGAGTQLAPAQAGCWWLFSKVACVS